MDRGYRRPTARPREFRASPTEPERRLWQALRLKQVEGVRFNRQFPIGQFICDFVARSAGLVVEVDGDTHSLDPVYDARRTAFLEQQGYRVVRFTNAEVMHELEGVVSRIAAALRDRPFPSPSRTREGSVWGPTIRWPG